MEKLDSEARNQTGGVGISVNTDKVDIVDRPSFA